MRPRWVAADPRVMDNLGRVALTRGPLIYAAESHDLAFPPQRFSADAEVDTLIELADESILEGVTTLKVQGLADDADFPDSLYADAQDVNSIPVSAKFIPYYSWCNRGPSHMQVWVRRL